MITVWSCYEAIKNIAYSLSWDDGLIEQACQQQASRLVQRGHIRERIFRVLHVTFRSGARFGPKLLKQVITSESAITQP